MLKLILTSLGLVVLSLNVNAQCVSASPTGNFGIRPFDNLVPCIERGVYFEQVIQFENLDSIDIGIGQGITLDYLQIDSITNLPCNVKWVSNRPDNRMLRAETACIRFFGITDDTVGQYDLGIYITIKGLTFLGDFSGEAQDLIELVESVLGPQGIDFNYVVRVKEVADTCPTINNQDSTLFREAKLSCPNPNEFVVNISGDQEICAGDTAFLTASVSNGTNPVINWIQGGNILNSASASTGVIPSDSETYVVEAVDSGGAGRATYNQFRVSFKPDPKADFSYSMDQNKLDFIDFSLRASSYAWNFGDGNTSTEEEPVHIYDTTGDYVVTLIVQGECKADTTFDTISVTAVGLAELSIDELLFDVVPNPANERAIVTFKRQVNEPISLQLLDLSGKQVSQITPDNIHLGKRVELDLSGFTKGFYILEARTNSYRYSKKLIIH